jgi:26S proteasome regulatory subunit N10
VVTSNSLFLKANSLDNSEWMRNGDYTPTRLEAQQDALNLITGAKTQSNPESTVAVVACAGKR